MFKWIKKLFTKNKSKKSQETAKKEVSERIRIETAKYESKYKNYTLEKFDELYLKTLKIKNGEYQGWSGKKAEIGHSYDDKTMGASFLFMMGTIDTDQRDTLVFAELGVNTINKPYDISEVKIHFNQTHNLTFCGYKIKRIMSNYEVLVIARKIDQLYNDNPDFKDKIPSKEFQIQNFICGQKIKVNV